MLVQAGGLLLCVGELEEGLREAPPCLYCLLCGVGLWMARQLVEDLVIGTSPTGGCSVLLTAT